MEKEKSWIILDKNIKGHNAVLTFQSVLLSSISTPPSASPSIKHDNLAQEGTIPALPTLGPMFENVQEAVEFIRKNDLRFDGMHITYEELMAYNF
jgi:hypothetical protein